jgi:uncharacterized protein (TIRG00374 family)
MNKTGRYFLAILVLVITVVGVVHVFTKSVDPKKVWDLLSDIPSLLLVLLLLLATAMMGVRAFRFYLLLKDQGMELSLWQAIKVYMAGQALSPLPGGEGARTVLLKMECGSSLSDSVTPLILLGITEMIVAVVISLIGGIFLNILRLAAVIALISVVGLIWLLVNHKLIVKLFKALPDKAKVQKAGKAIITTQKEVKGAIFEKESWKPSKPFLISLGLAVITDLLGGAILFSLALHYQLPFGFLFSLYIFAAATVLGELVPFSPGGVGATEGGMAGIMLLAGVDLPRALAVVVVFRAATLVYGILIGLVFLITFYGKKYVQLIKSPA